MGNNISLIMATVHRDKDVGIMIKSLISQSDQNFELIIIDQNTDNRLVPYVDAGLKAGLQIRHEFLFPPSLSKARNLGVSLANYNVIAFPDDDCWYENDVIENVRNNFMQKPSCHGLVVSWVEQKIGLNTKTDVQQLSLNEWRNFKGGNASSISLFLQKDVFNKVGCFDENLGVGKWFGAGEETDLVLRLLAAGSKVEYLETARVHHHFGQSFNTDFWAQAKSNRSRSRGTGALYAKHKISSYVIFRGFLAPIIKSILSGKWGKNLLLATVTSLGRIEGYLRWYWVMK